MQEENCKHFLTDIEYNINNKNIFNDQCLKCYDNPRSEKGLNICLKCFDGCCFTREDNHTKLHLLKRNHNIYMNLKEIKIEKKEKEVKITKLAVGLPGGADLEEEKYDKKVEIFCLSCNKKIEYENNEKLKNLIISIINSSSESQKSEIKAWEEKIFPCEHTLTLNQDIGKIIKENELNKCNDCDIDKNLWLCLVCGNISCGRKETGGNAHALAHFEKTKHPLAVKVGTISQNGDASLYCYTCDNDVKDENLSLHLSNFGLDIKNMKKTDKTVTELNLDININLTLSKVIEEGKVLTPLYGPGCTGMENIGNSCYMNAVLHILFSMEQFKKWYLNDAENHINSCDMHPSKCYLCQMSKIMNGIYSGNYSKKLIKKIKNNEDIKEEEYQLGIKITSFKLFFNKNNLDFMSTKPQDAFLYMQFFLDELKEYENKRNINPFSIFEFDIEKRLECSKCHSVRYSTNREWYLPFTVEDLNKRINDTDEVKIEECISQYLNEKIEVNCEKCKSNTKHVINKKMLNYPEYLIITFERFFYNEVGGAKSNAQFILNTENVDFKILSPNNSKEGENVIERLANGQEEIYIEPKFNINDLNYLLQCGIPELGAKWALLKMSDPELALGWYCENSENPEIKKPIPKQRVIQYKNSKKNNLYKEEDVNNLIAMGFTKEKAIHALKLNNNNFNNALDYLFNHPDEIIDDANEDKKEERNEEIKEINVGNGSIYDLYGYITHLGKSADHGHYVTHIRQENNNWKYFNDSKCNSWDNPPTGRGHIYFFKKRKK